MNRPNIQLSHNDDTMGRQGFVMRIDIFIPQELTVDETIELGVLAEQYGIGAVWAYNFTADYDPFMSLAVLARSTSEIRLGPTAISPFELHPLMMANSLLTLNQYSNGRACIVVGGGGGVIASMGIKPTRRVRAVRECVEILKGASTSAKEALNYSGEIYTIRNYRAVWATAKPPTIYVGANAPQMFRMAARVADGAMMSDFTLPMVKDAVKIMDQALTANQRPKENFLINNFWAWHVKQDKQEAIKEARRNLALRGVLQRNYLTAFLNEEDCDFVVSHMDAFWQAFRRKTHIIEGVPERIITALVDNLTSTGDLTELDKLIDDLRAFEDSGLTEIALGLHDDPAAAIKIIGEHVIPALR